MRLKDAIEAYFELPARMSQRMFGEAVGVSEATVTRWKNGVDVPDEDHIEAVMSIVSAAVPAFTVDEMRDAAKLERRDKRQAQKSAQQAGRVKALPVIEKRLDVIEAALTEAEAVAKRLMDDQQDPEN